MNENVFAQPVTKLKGIGAVRAAAYSRLGVRTVGDLLFDFPRAYENRGNIELLSEITDPDAKHAVILTVATSPKSVRLRSRRMTFLKFRAYDDSGVAEITFFNQDFLRDKFPLGSTFRFYGRIEKVGKKYSMSSPAFEPWYEDRPLRDLLPVYRLTDGVSQKQLSDSVAAAQALCGYEIPDFLPNEIRIANGLCTLNFAIKNIHCPESFKNLAAAKRRLIFDEFFNFALGISITRKRRVESGAPACVNDDTGELEALLPYALTGAQRRAVNDIAADMAGSRPMSRIIVGDVGCGKTVCAAAAMFIAVRNGRQAALMAPTEILARQHYADLQPLFERLEISCELLVGATSPAKKKKIYDALSSGELDTVIGTQALLSDGVSFARPGLVVTDEQHRFGVAQRAALTAGAEHVHTLAMSATPIPRSLALTIYGDLDISKIDEMPPGRQKVDTFAVDESYRARVNAFIEKTVRAGGQVYVVCPAIEEDPGPEGGEVGIEDITDSGFEERPPLTAATECAEKLTAALPDVRVALVHGRMKPAEKDAVMRAFAAGEADVLVSTTVIEVGVNVPNASLMIVENAERFGLSQLHQLRGRVGRGSRKSYCILISACRSENARRRLSVLTRTNNGFEIAEEDLELRGPGDFFGKSSGGIRQSGGVRFRFADLCGDAGLLMSATEAAHGILAADPGLAEHPLLREEVAKMFGENE